MAIILGIDPGSRITGYGLIKTVGNRYEYLGSGCIRITAKPLAEKLQQIYTGVNALITEYQPDLAAIERVFFSRNADTALKLGQARGAAIVAIGRHGLSMSEYTPREVKQAIVGYGAAEKQQMQHMVKVLLSLTEVPPTDAADALAIALCHAHQSARTALIGE